jgi:L-alanine-DL-glutamate epimerase-like enolase superfamily enzyme
LPNTPNTFETLAESEMNQVHVTDIKAFQLKNHGIQSIIKVETDQGIYGVGEAGLPANIVQGYLDFMKEWLIGQDALSIEKNYAYMIRMRAQWHAHWTQNPTVSGIDMALWDIAGKVFNKPVSSLLTGRFRDETQLYVNNGGPDDWFDKAVCQDWAQKLKSDPRGFKVIKVGFERLLGRGMRPDRYQPGWLSPMLDPSDFKLIQRGYENIREALGWDMDFIVHCHNEWDLASALGIAEAIAPAKPLWIEDALPVMYSDSWKAFRASSPVRVMTGEKLEHPAEFLQFMANGAVDAIHPDLAFVGGLTGGRKIADLAELYYIPVATHVAGSYVQMIANAHWGASVRNFVMAENQIPNVGFLHEEMSEEGYQVKNGNLITPTGPGLGITIRPDVFNSIIQNGKW